MSLAWEAKPHSKLQLPISTERIWLSRLWVKPLSSGPLQVKTTISLPLALLWGWFHYEGSFRTGNWWLGMFACTLLGCDMDFDRQGHTVPDPERLSQQPP